MPFPPRIPPTPLLPSTYSGAEDPAICRRCADQGPTCCRLDPGQERFCFPLSVLEWERILDFAGEKGAFAQEPNSQPFIDNVINLFPGERALVEQLFPRVKHHLRLATTPDGRCVFLSPGGCLLPNEARPYYCRLFPIWIYGERLAMFTADRCLAVRELRSIQNVLRAVGLSEAQARELHGRLRLAWGLPPKVGMELLQPSFRRYAR